MAILDVSHKDTVYTTEQIRQLDKLAIADGTPGFELMTRAAQALLDQIKQHWPTARSLCILCGGGNNGGDGYVLARLALNEGWSIRLFAFTEPAQLQGDASHAYASYTAAQGRVERFNDLLPACDILVDGLLGTGLNRPIDERLTKVIALVNQHPAPVLAIDIPSGLNGDTGAPMNSAIRADMTVTFIGLKAGLLTGQARDYTGTIRLEILNLPSELFAQSTPVSSQMHLITSEHIRQALPPRARVAHKGHFGHALLIGGAQGMSGSIQLAGLAALRTGCGRMTLASIQEPKQQATALVSLSPELMTLAISDAQALRALATDKNVLAIGPGLGQSEQAHQFLLACLKLSATDEWQWVLDADALNLLAGHPQKRDHWILTPHPAEAGRLLGCSPQAVEKDRVAAVRALQKQYGGVIVLKGAGTLLATDTSIAFCTAGNPGMATAGMGDVLTGIITALLAQGMQPAEAAAIGVQVHAQAADNAAKDGERGLMASDVIQQLRQVVNP